MAKHKRKEKEPIMNTENTNNGYNSYNTNYNNNPFGLDPNQLIGLLGGNFDMNSMGNLLASMNTSGFNLESLAPIAKMVGIDLGNNFQQGNGINNGMNANINNTMGNMGNNNSFKDNSNQGKTTSSATNNNGGTNARGNDSTQSTNNKINTDTRKSTNSNTGMNTKNNKEQDENLKFLISLKSYVHPDRIKFIDRIIELYNKGMFKDI